MLTFKLPPAFLGLANPGVHGPLLADAVQNLVGAGTERVGFNQPKTKLGRLLNVITVFLTHRPGANMLMIEWHKAKLARLPGSFRPFASPFAFPAS